MFTDHVVGLDMDYPAARARLLRVAHGDWLDGISRLGITAGASAPELLVGELIAACRERYAVTIEEVRVTDENTVFKLPHALVA